MPSSRASTIPYVIATVKRIRPSSILDVGVGFGKWGYLFREYTDIIQSEQDAARYSKAGWQVRIEGIEGYERYLHPAHDFIYDKIHTGTVERVLPSLGAYDVVFFGDIIEHLPLPEGQAVLREAMSHATRAVILTTPRYDTGQKELCGNTLEMHHSLWGPKDFARVAKYKIAWADRDTLVVMFPCHESVWDIPLKPERPVPLSRWAETFRDHILGRGRRWARALLRGQRRHEARRSQ